MEVFEKSQTVDPEVRAHIYSLVSAIGGSSNAQDGQYVLGDDALACLKDLSRWIRLYDDRTNRHDVKRCMAEANLVRGDLLPILAQQGDKTERSILATKVALNCLDLLNTLTWPIERKEETMTVNTHRHLPYIQLAQVTYKRAILYNESAQILRTAISIAVPAISQPRTERSPRDDSIIGVVLYFLRNMAIISQPADLPSQGDENDVSRLATINAFHQQHVLQLLLTIASSISDEYPMHDVVVMEILFQLVKGIDPKELFKDEKQLQDEKQDEFKALLNKEKAMNAAYARNAPSRHHRFGTMIWVKRPDEKVSTLSGQNVIFDEQKTMQQMDSSKVWNKPKPRRKKTEVQDENNDFDTTVHLDESTRKVLRGFVQDFLDSSFNPLFNSLRRTLTSEERVQKYNNRQYYYLMAWFLQAERARQDLFKKTGQTNADEDSPFAYIAAVMTQENFILLGRRIQQSMDDKEWSDLHACMRAFTQILLTVGAMAESSSEDDQEIAENIQNRIFYEETTHDQVIAVVRGYNEQGFAFLDACTDMAHTFLRMLEKYSKQNADMQVRSKRRARKKRKAEATANGAKDDADAPSEAEDEVEAQRTVNERRFDFGRFASKFMTESCVNTFVRFTSFYADLSDEQLKRAHRFFYRCAFKLERSIFLFRVDILHLFNRMVRGPNGLSKENPMFKEWEELVKQVFKRCLRKLDERRELMVEMLFMKLPPTIYYLENGFDAEVAKSRPRPPAELTVKPGMSEEDGIAVAVSVLVNQGKLDTLVWVKDCLSKGVEERRAWEDEHNARAAIDAHSNIHRQDNENNPETQEGNQDIQETTESIPQQEQPKAPSIFLHPDNSERKSSLFKDKFLRLLLKLLLLERLGDTDDPDASWIIPSSLTSETLLTNLALIRKFEFDLPTFDGMAPESLLRNKSAAGLHVRADRMAAAAAKAAAFGSDSEGDSDLDEEAAALFEPGGPTNKPSNRGKPGKKRKLQRRGEDITEEERKRRAEERKEKDKEKNAKIKSLLRVTDSDDEEDEDRDTAFFALEEQRRKKISGVIRNALLKEVDDDEGVKKKGKRKAAAADKGGKGKGKKRKTIEVESDGESVEAMEVVDISDDVDSEDDDVMEEGEGDDTPMHDVSLLRKTGVEVNEEEEEEDEVRTRIPRGRVAARLPFLDDSDGE